MSNTSWDYAVLSKLASENGGPRALIETIKESSREAGKAEMVPKIIIVSCVSVVGGYCIGKIKQYFTEKRAISEQAAVKAEEELIKGIEEYDKEHTEVKS